MIRQGPAPPFTRGRAPRRPLPFPVQVIWAGQSGSGHTDDEIAKTVAKEAAHAFDLLEPAIGDYAIA
ncbi:hypothetical protein ABZ499_00235 [Streptomyces sp. NPDC019990]|uniref:hypothetical protein n=1 Tax=Streptomyces sp. NPDC019990 TaxID=3154693 RepID=UPI0033D45A85